MYQLKRVQSKKDWEAFIDLPWSIYKDDPNWVPPLKVAVRDLLDVNKNPFFKHSYMRPIIAYKDGKVIGRIVGIIDENHNRFHKEQTALFGFFEAIDDSALAKLLLDDVADWAVSRGMKTLRGPLNPSTNHECGLLIEGFDDPPFVMMPYNPPYYAKLFESCGLSKSKDLFAYLIDKKTVRFSERLMAHIERLKQAKKVTFRSIKMKDFDREVDTILQIYNDAWESNWGFVPMDEEEFRHLAKDLKAVLDPRLLLIVDVAGEPAGFGLTLPDVNQAFKKIEDGKLFPLGLLKLLWYAKGPGRRKTINRMRILTLGVKRKYREFGLGPLLYSEYLRRGVELGYSSAEASWILEDNKPMNQALKHMCGKVSKLYRIYDKTVA